MIGLGFGLALALMAGCAVQPGNPTSDIPISPVEGVEVAAVGAALVGPTLIDGAAGAVMAAARPLAIADILSVVATKKTIIDHAASMSTGLDCSTVRSLNGGNYCEKPYENHPPAVATLYCYRELADVTCYGQPMPYQHLVAIRPGGRQSTY